MIGVQIGADLTNHADMNELFRDWLRGDGAIGSATTQLQAFLAGPTSPPRAATAWRNDRWRKPWLADFVEDVPDPREQAQLERTVERLVEGKAEVVITGQQPGFLGGPLYTFYKIATTVVLAELRTAAGHPTIPVFWSADDDDDIREALQPVAWDSVRSVLIRHEEHGRRELSADRMVGVLPMAEIATGAAAWLGELSDRGPLAADLATIWREGVADDLGWGRVQRRALLRAFAGRGLLVVYGNDPGMHEAAAAFYEDLWSRRDALRNAARRGGAAMEQAGYAAAIGEPSIQRFLHLGRDGRRQPLSAEHGGDLPPARDLRPGVLARSLVQDWLFRPAGVVVGPGEVAYLKQLEPVYELFGLPRTPLLPRLFAQLGPEGHGEFQSWAMDRADRDEGVPEAQDNRMSEAVVASARGDIEALLHDQVGVSDDRLDDLVGHVLDRWTRYLDSVVKRERRRRRSGEDAGQPAWLRPDGRRQERAMAAIGAAALWNDEFVQALAHASRRHIDTGLDGDWREYLLTVPEP